MKPLLITCCCLLLSLPAWGETTPLVVGGDGPRPLNLSLPRDVPRRPASILCQDADDTATRNMREATRTGDRQPGDPRYGSGYEARQRSLEVSGELGYRGAANGLGGDFGQRGGGRGGMGRGR